MSSSASASHSIRLSLSTSLAGALSLAALCFSGAVASASAQTVPPDHPPATVPAESERDAKTYVLESLGRHGPSHFPRVRHPEVQYEPGETLTFDRFHTLDVMYAWLRRWAERYPDLIEVYQVGTSLEGRPILQATLTNRKTGPATEKPAAFFEGAPVRCIEAVMPPVKLFGVVGGLDFLYLPPWLVAYLLIAIPFVTILKRTFRIA